MRIAMIGATGLLGGLLAARLARSHELLRIGRRSAGMAGVREAVAPIAAWPSLLADERIDVAISTLGTTRREAGSWHAMRAVDVDAVLAFAHAAQAAGARQFLAVSSALARPGSRHRYLAMKGETEVGLRSLMFDRLDLVRPGLLRGARDGRPRRGERLAIAASPLVDRLLVGRLDRLASIDAAAVAAAMATLVGAAPGGVHVHHNRDLHTRAARR